MMKSIRQIWVNIGLAIAMVALSGCAELGGPASGPAPATGSSKRVNAAADTATYQSVTYANVATKGPAIIVLPGDVKSNNATFTQRYGPNNIADYAELELSKANFQVLERDNLGSVLREIELAYNLGDAAKAQVLFQKGALQNTRWIIKFDVLRAEKIAEASGGFSGKTLGNISRMLLGGKTGSVANEGASSVETSEAAGVWLVGMRYKIIDARTTQQVATGYAEDKLEVGSTGLSAFGVSSQRAGGKTLDALVIQLTQKKRGGNRSELQIDQSFWRIAFYEHGKRWVAPVAFYSIGSDPRAFGADLCAATGRLGRQCHQNRTAGSARRQRGYGWAPAWLGFSELASQ